MPKWIIHDKWAKKAGIPKEVSYLVNQLIDFPQKCQEFLDFCEQDPDARVYSKGKPTKMTIGPWITHDSGRQRTYAREIQLKFLCGKGGQYIKAWYLHHVLDYMKFWLMETPSKTASDVGDILQKKMSKMFGSLQEQELLDIKNFVMIHLREIAQDCR